MKYPRRSPYLAFRKTGRDTYEVTDWLTEEAFAVNAETAGFLSRLDGRHDPNTLRACEEISVNRISCD